MHTILSHVVPIYSGQYFRFQTDNRCKLHFDWMIKWQQFWPQRYQQIGMYDVWGYGVVYRGKFIDDYEYKNNPWIQHGLHSVIGSASLARSIRIRFHFRHRTGRIRSVSDHRAGRVWRSRHRSKTPNCLPGARDQVPALFRNAIERREAQTAARRSRKVPTFDMLRRMANPLSLLNWWLHKYDNEDDNALFQV